MKRFFLTECSKFMKFSVVWLLLISSYSVYKFNQLHPIETNNIASIKHDNSNKLNRYIAYILSAPAHIKDLIKKEALPF